MKNRVILFLHIPKTGGTTLHNILLRNYSASQQKLILGPQDLDDFQNSTLEERDRFSLIRGHFVFGIHKLISRDYTYITFLRDPKERLLSQYRYIITNPRHPRHKVFKDGNISLEQFLQDGLVKNADNAQVRSISGNRDLPFRSIGETHFNQAKENLERDFLLYAPLTEFDSFLVAGKLLFGWKGLYYLPLNVNKTKKPPISKKEQSLLEELTFWDEKILEFSRQKFKERVLEFGPSFSEEMHRFQKMNARMRPFLKAKRWLLRQY